MASNTAINSIPSSDELRGILSKASILVGGQLITNEKGASPFPLGLQILTNRTSLTICKYFLLERGKTSQ
jgi:hypothetical protein